MSSLCIAGVDCDQDYDGQVWPLWAVAWSVCLSSVATANLAMCLRAAMSRKLSTDGVTRSYQVLMRNLGVPYVLVNALRSYFPAQYGERFVLWDSPFSSILLHRSVATIAEVCWVLQIATGVTFIQGQLWHARNGMKQWQGWSWYNYTSWSCKMMVIIICIAECCSFCGTLTKSNFWFALEEAFWCAAFAVTGPTYFHLLHSTWSWPTPEVADGKAAAKYDKSTFSAWMFALVFSFFSATYCYYMAVIDVPFYWEAYKQQMASGFVPLSVIEGFWDALTGWQVTTKEADWSFAAAWSSVYFAAGSWASIAMMCAPRLPVAAPVHGLSVPLRKIESPVPAPVQGLSVPLRKPES